MVFRDAVHVFWGPGDRVGDVHRYAERLERMYPGEASKLHSCDFIEARNTTILVAFGEPWREYMIRQPNWIEAAPDAPLPGPDGMAQRSKEGGGE